jgi:hypothetical protein
VSIKNARDDDTNTPVIDEADTAAKIITGTEDLTLTGTEDLTRHSRANETTVSIAAIHFLLIVLPSNTAVTQLACIVCVYCSA